MSDLASSKGADENWPEVRQISHKNAYDITQISQAESSIALLKGEGELIDELDCMYEVSGAAKPREIWYKSLLVEQEIHKDYDDDKNTRRAQSKTFSACAFAFFHLGVPPALWSAKATFGAFDRLRFINSDHWIWLFLAKIRGGKVISGLTCWEE